MLDARETRAGLGTLMAEEKRSSLQQPPPEPGPRPEPELTEQTRVGIPQPDGSVLFVTPTSSLGSGYLASAPGHGGYLYLAPGVLGGEGDGFSPPPSYDHGASLPPKPQLPEPSRAPERSYSLAAAPNPPQQFYPSFQHQAYQPYQPPPSYPSIQQQPYQPVPGQPPFPQHPYRSYQPVAAQTQHPNQQVPGDFPAVSYQHPPPVQAMAIAQQPPPPPKRVKTSRKFDINTVDGNQYYLSICLLILVCVFCNPFPLLCAIQGFLAAKTAAIANEGGDLQQAQLHHKRARFFNIGAAVTFIGTGIGIIAIPIIVVFSSTTVASN